MGLPGLGVFRSRSRLPLGLTSDRPLAAPNVFPHLNLTLGQIFYSVSDDFVAAHFESHSEINSFQNGLNAKSGQTTEEAYLKMYVDEEELPTMKQTPIFKGIGTAWTRTRDQAIMSRLL